MSFKYYSDLLIFEEEIHYGQIFPWKYPGLRAKVDIERSYGKKKKKRSAQKKLRRKVEYQGLPEFN